MTSAASAYEAGDGLFGFVLWVFAETSVGIIKEGIKFMTPTFKEKWNDHNVGYCGNYNDCYGISSP